MLMKNPARMIPLLLLAGSMSLAAQGAAPGADIEIGESIDVRVVNVEAVVTGRRGERIQGLSPAEFRLLVDGKEVPIDYFTEVRGGTAVEARGTGPASPVTGTVGRNLLVFVDQSFTIQSQLSLVLRLLEENIDRLGPEDRMALVAADPDGHLKVLSDWTSDAGRLRSLLAELRNQPTGGAHLRVALDSLKNDRILLNMVETGNAWGDANVLTQPEIGQWWDLRAARQPEDLSTLELYVAAKYSDTALWAADSFSSSALAAMRAFSSAPGRKAMLLFSGGWPAGVEPRVIEAANLLGFSLYPVDVSGLQSSAVPFDASQPGLSADTANVSYGLISSEWEQRVEYGFEVMARETGGKALLDGKRESAFERTLDDTSSYYWLGFSPTWKADGRRHDIRLEVRGSGLKVRARRGYSDLSPRAQQALEAESRRVLSTAADK
jgi:VWFA-related protein